VVGFIRESDPWFCYFDYYERCTTALFITLTPRNMANDDALTVLSEAPTDPTKQIMNAYIARPVIW
jgi:hypothetical protein